MTKLVDLAVRGGVIVEKAAGPLNAKLIAAGWKRDNTPGLQHECGVPPFCVRSARWTKPGSGNPMCAQHAWALEQHRL